MQNKCYLYESGVSVYPKEQHPLRTSFGYSGNNQQMSWKRIQDIKTNEQFEEYKLLEKKV